MKRFASTIPTHSCRQWGWASPLCLILLGWGTSVQAAEPIPIPVPPPEVATSTAIPLGAEPIPIPVPPPEAPPPLPEPVAAESTLQRLPVPSTPIPIGEVGAEVAMNQLPPPPETTGIDMSAAGQRLTPGGRFRVIVLDLREGDTANQERLRSLVPEVLPITAGQQRALQVGSFQDEMQASELRAYMEVNGFRAEIQRLP
ncbi:hypothetical protein RYO59_000732 [Thermosynechococcaceae cyanobacterium Okahandja]